MSNRIMIVTGSPRRRGNTARVVDWVVDALQAAGAEVDRVDACEVAFEQPGCTSCMGCQKQEAYGCVIDDEASEVVRRMMDCDAVVLATPVYWMGPTAQIKRLVDRMFSLMKMSDTPPTTALEGKTLGLVATSGGKTEHGLGHLNAQYETAAGLMNLRYQTLLVPLAPTDPSTMSDNDEVKQRAGEFARQLLGS